MKQMGLAVLKAHEWGFKRPRAWWAKYGGIDTMDEDMHETVEEYREYRTVKTEIKKLVQAKSLCVTNPEQYHTWSNSKCIIDSNIY